MPLSNFGLYPYVIMSKVLLKCEFLVSCGAAQLGWGGGHHPTSPPQHHGTGELFCHSFLGGICKPTNQRFATVLRCPRRYLTNPVDYDKQHQHQHHTVSSKGHRSMCSYFCSWLRILHIGRGMPSSCILYIHPVPNRVCSVRAQRRNAEMHKMQDGQ